MARAPRKPQRQVATGPRLQTPFLILSFLLVALWNFSRRPSVEQVDGQRPETLVKSQEPQIVTLFGQQSKRLDLVSTARETNTDKSSSLQTEVFRNVNDDDGRGGVERSQAKVAAFERSRRVGASKKSEP